MHVIAGTPEAERVAEIYLDGELVTSREDAIVRKHVVEANDEEGWIIRFATEEEVERLVTAPGLVWPYGKDVLIRETGEVSIVWIAV